MALAQEKTYTIDDIYALPDGQRAELIDGRIYMMAPPSACHQDIIFSISRKIADYIDAHRGDCKIYLAPYAVFLNADDRNYVEPDISVICHGDRLDEKGCHGAPDLVIEIVSPSSRKMDYVRKPALYQETGVQEYWIVDPEKEIVTVYTAERWDIPICHPFTKRIQVGIYGELYLEFTEFIQCERMAAKR